MTVLSVSTQETRLSKFALVLQQLAAGRSNAVVAVTLAANASTTVVAFRNCGAGSAPLPVPLSAHAAAEIGNGTLYISNVSAGAFTITHADNAQTDRTFLFVCLG